MNVDADDARDAEDLRRFADLARRLRPDEVTWDEPPDDLWDRIRGELGPEAPATVAGAAPAGDAPVTPLAPRRPDTRRSAGAGRGAWLLAAAAALVIAAVAAVLVATSNDPFEPTGEVVATTALDPLADGGSGTAELVRLDDGGYELLLDTTDLDPGDGFLEVWTIDTEVTSLISLGPLRPDGTYPLPPGFDPADHPVVDISREHFDGDPTHSGDSLVRGQLPV